MAGVEGGDQMEGLGATDLTDDDAIGSEPEGGAEQVADGDLAGAFGIGPSCLETDQMAREPELGGILDGDHPLPGGDVGSEQVEEGGLAGAGGARDDDRLPSSDRFQEQTDLPAGGGAGVDQTLQIGHALGESTYRHQGIARRGGWQHRMEPAPIGKTGIDHGHGPIDPETQWGQCPLHHGDDLPRGLELHFAAHQALTTIDPDLLRAIHQDIGDQRVVDESLQGPQTEDVAHDRAHRPPHPPGRLETEQTLRLRLDRSRLQPRVAQGDRMADPGDQAHGRSQT
jgi:hypothetical protein